MYAMRINFSKIIWIAFYNKIDTQTGTLNTLTDESLRKKNFAAFHTYFNKKYQMFFIYLSIYLSIFLSNCIKNTIIIN